MDWSNEPWIKLYLRKTTSYLLAPWQSKVIRDPILRELNRAGVFDISGHSVNEALAVATMLPIELFEVGLPPLIANGTFEVRHNFLVMPKYLEAQRSRKTSAQKQRDYRESIRDKSNANVTHEYKSNQDDDEGNETVTSPLI